MVWKRPETVKKRSVPIHIDHRTRVRSAVAVVASMAATAVVNAGISSSTDEPMPMHTSILTGQGWVDELLEGMSTLHTQPS